MNPPLMLGAPAPWFHAPALGGNPHYAFHTVAGRWVLMLFAGSAMDPRCVAALRAVMSNRDLFDDERACFFGITADRSNAEQGHIHQDLPGIRWLLDYDSQVSAAFGAMPPMWIALDPMLRVCLAAPADRTGEVLAHFRKLAGVRMELPAPILVVPNVLPAELCAELIETYEREGGTESGFMREVDGVTQRQVDHSHKRRSDCGITDPAMLHVLRGRMFHTLRPLVERAFQFNATRIERFVVARYDADVGGYFRPHRDNTTKGTAHRRFAVTINLDTTRYEGGDLCFPEFGQHTYRAPTGGAVVFSCSLLHEARPVTKGRRYAFLPFLYDDDGARLREANMAFVAPEIQGYRSGLEPSED